MGGMTYAMNRKKNTPVKIAIDFGEKGNEIQQEKLLPSVVYQFSRPMVYRRFAPPDLDAGDKPA